MNCLTEDMIHRILPNFLSYPHQQDTMMIEVNLYVDGQIRSITVDDHLPVSESGNLLFAGFHHTSGDGDWSWLWGAFIEKAVAKLFGSYQVLENGHSAEALAMLSGGYIVEDISIDSYIKAFHDPLRRRFAVKYIDSVFLARDLQEEGENEDRRDPESAMAEFLLTSTRHGNLMVANVTNAGSAGVGFAVGHTYSIASVVQHKGDCWIKLINPWGKSSYRFKYDRMKLKALEFSSDNGSVGKISYSSEIWISIQSFCRYFSTLLVAHRNSTTNPDSSKSPSSIASFVRRLLPSRNNNYTAATVPFDRVLDLSQSDEIHHRPSQSWKASNSGGCINHRRTFFQNPNYLLTLPADAIVTISLKQSVLQSIQACVEQGRMREIIESVNTLVSMGFTVFRVEDNRSVALENVLDADFWDHSSSSSNGGSEQRVRIAGMVTFLNACNVVARFRLTRGSYVILPSTFLPDQHLDYSLTVNINYQGSSSESGSSTFKRLPRLNWKSQSKVYAKISFPQQRKDPMLMANTNLVLELALGDRVSRVPLDSLSDYAFSYFLQIQGDRDRISVSSELLLVTLKDDTDRIVARGFVPNPNGNSSRETVNITLWTPSMDRMVVQLNAKIQYVLHPDLACPSSNDVKLLASNNSSTEMFAPTPPPPLSSSTSK